MTKHPGLALVAAAAFSISSFELLAQNLVGNGDFDTDVGGWASYHCLLAWDPADSQLSSTSGSAWLSNDNDAEPTTAVSACADGVIAGQSYDFGGWIWIPPGQASSGSAKLGLYWHDGAGCTGSLTVGPQTPLVQLPGGWVPLTLLGQVAPAGAQSAQVTAYNIKSSPGTGPFVVHHDGIYLGDFGGIFADGFESGGTNLWSSTVN